MCLCVEKKLCSNPNLNYHIPFLFLDTYIQELCRLFISPEILNVRNIYDTNAVVQYFTSTFIVISWRFSRITPRPYKPVAVPAKLTIYSKQFIAIGNYFLDENPRTKYDVRES